MGYIFRVGVTILMGTRRKAMIRAGRVVIASAGGIAKSVVGVVYLLKFRRAGWTFRGVGGDTVGVGFQSLSEV